MSSAIYTPLKSSSSSEELCEDPQKTTLKPFLCSRCRGPISTKPSLSFWAIAISLLSLVLNSLILLASSRVVHRCSDPMTEVTNDNIHLLRRPSPFIGFDTITRPVPVVERELINFPQIIQQVNKNQPYYVYDDDPLRYMSVEGLVSPESRQVQVTHQISTLVQFRVIDYGMEKCELHIEFPANSTTDAGSHSFLIHINRLDSPIPLNTKTLTFATKPRAQVSLAPLRVNPREDTTVYWQQPFDCKWDELLTFELACDQSAEVGDSASDCWLEWWQDRRSATIPPGM
ncbi:hypothetical protein D9758_014878 [Tetrapyrgos nigripes]|uniref:Ubiquitin 3 binding protein But2 C-terminal domain-containing protein n=2 Tax=Tetrapyrgos nigripes TaxID=182062 RepID=A0A8H5CDV2_9AGAR|nr:hypothetical protein D9758_014878 [Tetrapyrgos nigripes]